MQHIVLTPEQVQMVLQAREPIEVHDSQGRTIAHLKPLSPADIEDIEQARRVQAEGKAKVTAADVMAHLCRLEGIHRRDGLDEARALELLQQMRKGEEV